MKSACKYLCAACLILMFKHPVAFGLTNNQVRFSLDGGGAVRTPGSDGTIVSDDEIVSSGSNVSGTLPLPDFPGKDRIMLDALIVHDEFIIFSSDVDFSIGTNDFADEDLEAYDSLMDTYSMYLDGSTIGIPSNLDLDAATLVPGSNLLWLSVDGPFSSVCDHDILEYNLTSGLFTKKYDGHSDLGIPTRANIDALYYDGSNLYFSLDTTEDISGYRARDDEIWVWNVGGGYMAGVVTALHTEVIADIDALDEWQ